MKKVLWVSDGYVMTGFGRVAHEVLDRIHRKYEVHHLAINYYGQPHNYPWRMYPASLGGDIWGVRHLPKMVSSYKFDAIVLFNDLPVIAYYLEALKDTNINLDNTRIIVYFPVDSMFMNPLWFRDYDIVSEVATYSNFGKLEVESLLRDKYSGEIRIIRHGIDRKRFRKMPKELAVETLISEITGKDTPLESIKHLKDKLLNTQVFLNANRNQPRKRIDLTIVGFAEFVKRHKLTPNDVSLYLHMGTVDAGVDIIKLASVYEITDYLILTHAERNHKFYGDHVLNAIYNVADYGINTSMGEGFGLVSLEHASVGKPQIVPRNSVLPEIWGNEAYYIECPIIRWVEGTTVLFMEATPKTVSDAMSEAFFDENKRIMKSVFEDPSYRWGYIARQFEELIDGKVSKRHKKVH